MNVSITCNYFKSHFSKKAKCLYCKKILLAKGASTKALWDHLRCIHPTKNSEAKKEDYVSKKAKFDDLSKETQIYTLPLTVVCDNEHENTVPSKQTSESNFPLKSRSFQSMDRFLGPSRQVKSLD